MSETTLGTMSTNILVGNPLEAFLGIRSLLLGVSLPTLPYKAQYTQHLPKT